MILWRQGRIMAKFTETVTREVHCPYCGDAKVNKWGKNANGKQTYRCKPCGKRFLDTGAVHGRKTPSNHVGAAISLFYRGMSLQATGRGDGRDVRHLPNPASARCTNG